MQAELKAPYALGREFELGRAYALTAYDAAYLAVAVATGATLATNDERLRKSAQRLGVPLFSVLP